MQMGGEEGMVDERRECDIERHEEKRWSHT